MSKGIGGDKIHFNGLNGIRAIAAISVVLSHIGLSLDLFGLQKLKGFEFASFGVTIFFSLSGFLITYLLLTEKRRFEKIDIKKFYIRRVLRIWPLYFLYLCIAVFTTYLYNPELLPGSISWYLFIGANIPFIIGTSLPLLTHYWSLAVEEQFYLFWPWLVKKKENVFKAISIFLLTWLMLKLIARFIYWQSGNMVPYMILEITRFDCMAIGALGAILFFKKKQSFLQICFSYPSQVISWAVLGLIAINYFHIFSIFDHEIVAGLIVIIIVNVSSNPKSIIKLNSPIFEFLGRISYAIYVFHPLIIFLLSKIIVKWFDFLSYPFRSATVFIISLVATIFVATLSYYLFEKRFLRLKTRFSKVVSES